MSKNRRNNVFIFEGPDVSGKTTQVNKVKQMLESHGLKVGALKYPHVGEVHANEVYKLLNASRAESTDINNIVKMTFYNTINKYNTFDQLLKLSYTYDIVLIDRYILSSLVYDYARIADLVNLHDNKNKNLDVSFCEKITTISRLSNKCVDILIDMLLLKTENNEFPFKHVIFRKSKAISALSDSSREYTSTDKNKYLQKVVESCYNTIYIPEDKKDSLWVRNNCEEFELAILAVNNFFENCCDKGKGIIIDTDKIINYEKDNLSREGLITSLESVTSEITNYILKEIKR